MVGSSVGCSVVVEGTFVDGDSVVASGFSVVTSLVVGNSVAVGGSVTVVGKLGVLWLLEAR